MDNDLISKLMLGLNNRRGERQFLHDTHRASSKRKQKHYKIRKNTSHGPGTSNLWGQQTQRMEERGRMDLLDWKLVWLCLLGFFLLLLLVLWSTGIHDKNRILTNILMFEMSQSFSHGDAGWEKPTLLVSLKKPKHQSTSKNKKQKNIRIALYQNDFTAETMLNKS